MTEFIPVNEPLIGEREKELVLNCLNTGWISSEGSYVKEFESKFSENINKKYGIACSSGTAALELTLASLNLNPGFWLSLSSNLTENPLSLISFIIGLT